MIIPDYLILGSLMIRIDVLSVFVDNQEKARRFYTERLGFVEKVDLPIGSSRWITVVSPADPDGVQLVLEPNDHPAAMAFQYALFSAGIPSNAFGVDDLRQDHARLVSLGVRFVSDPQPAGPVLQATLDDTCGNLIELHQVIA